MKRKKLVGGLLSLGLMLTSLLSTPAQMVVHASGVEAYEVSAETTQERDVQDGVTLHCWNWSYKNIEANMEKIAALGYTSIQTSPIQQAKEGTNGKAVGTNWWVYYQPANFTIDNTGNSALGTKAEFESMCDTAHSYGIKVIVDVVANHLGNKTGNDVADTVLADIRYDASCWHDISTNIWDYSSRYNITQYCMGGLPDLNTGSSKIQNYVLNFLKECIDAGADGFRFDAAKHIETPEDSSFGCGSDFWPTVINGAAAYAASARGIDLYCYGEILDQPDSAGALSVSAYTKYMSITDNQQGNNLRGYINEGNAQAAGSASFCKNTTADNLVLWAESHDTYADNSSSWVSVANINKTWALVAARADAMGLYFARPYSTSSQLGAADVTGWSYSEVGAINRFHNAFVGETEYMANENGIAYCERGNSGVVLVNCNGTGSSVNVTAHTMADGTYKDQISGDEFVVSNGRISGNIGGTGIAVVYNISEKPEITLSQNGGSFSTETLALTAKLTNAASGTYQIGNNEAVSFTGSAEFRIGADMEIGDSVVVKLTAVNGTDTTEKSYTFEKVKKTENTAYLELPDGWSSTVYCYAYSEEDESNTNGAWPGAAMTCVSGSIYKYEVPDSITNPLVIFTDGNNQYPAAMQKGLELSGGMIYKDGTWSTYAGEIEIPSENIAYIAKDSSWGNTMYCYVYSADNESNCNGAWPGVTMVYVSENIYKYEVPDSITNPLVIFTDGYNQYPGAMQAGLPLSGSMIYNNGSWTNY